jgi:hypothetical protein
VSFDVRQKKPMQTENPLLEAFVEARDSAISEYQGYLAGRYPKNPNEKDIKIISLIESLLPDQKVEGAALLSTLCRQLS